MKCFIASKRYQNVSKFQNNSKYFTATGVHNPYRLVAGAVTPQLPRYASQRCGGQISRWLWSTWEKICFKIRLSCRKRFHNQFEGFPQDQVLKKQTYYGGLRRPMGTSKGSQVVQEKRRMLSTYLVILLAFCSVLGVLQCALVALASHDTAEMTHGTSSNYT